MIGVRGNGGRPGACGEVDQTGRVSRVSPLRLPFRLDSWQSRDSVLAAAFAVIALIPTFGQYRLVLGELPERASDAWRVVLVLAQTLPLAEAGALIGAAFLWRRSLWLVTALHATWNGLEQLFGIPVPGHVDPSLLIASTPGPAILTGGGFGLEASLIPVAVSLLLTAALLRAPRSRRGGMPSAEARNGVANELAESVR